jgi:hypothetical protein
MNMRKIIISCSIFIALAVIAGTVELPLPDGVVKNSEVTAKIESCDLKKSTGGKTAGSPNFVGFHLSDGDAPYIRWNPERDEFKIISALCNKKAYVKIWYKASRLILRPKVTYWLKEYRVVKT